MLNIFKHNIHGIMTLNPYSVVNNNLIISLYVRKYINVSDYNTFEISSIMLAIDMNKRDIIIYDTSDSHPISIIDDNMYIYERNGLVRQNIKIEYASDFGHYFIFPKKLEKWQSIVDDNFGGIRSAIIGRFYKLKNDIYYYVKVTNGGVDDPIAKYIFRKFEDNSVYLTVNLSMDDTSVNVTNGEYIINLSFESCNILHHKNTLIFFDEVSCYVKVDLDSCTFKVMNMEVMSDNKFNRIIISDCEILCQYGDDPIIINDGKIMSDVDNRVKIIYNLFNDTHDILNFNKYIETMRSFIYNGKKHYIIVDVNFNLDIYVREIDYFKNIYNPPKTFEKDSIITIGTKDENVAISFDLLVNRSYFINSLHDVLKGNSEDVLISNNFKNVTLYKKFVEERKYDDENLYDLYVIANYMQDCNINYLAEIIILYVKQNDIDIIESFKYLDLLHSSTCDEQLTVLIHVVYKKYNEILFLEMIADTKLLLNNYIYKVLKN